MERYESLRAPPTPPPSEDRLFTDWSSLDSPRVRTSSQNVSVQDTEQVINQPDNQTAQPGTEPAQVEVEGNTLSDDVTTLSTHQQPNQVGTRLMDMGTNTSDIEVRSQRDGVKVIASSNDEETLINNRNEQIPVSCNNLSISRHDDELWRGSHIRTHDIGRLEMIPQLDGPISVCSRRRILENMRTEQKLIQRTAVIHKREYPGQSSDDSHGDRRIYDERRPPVRRYQKGSGRPPDRGNNWDRGYSRRGRPPDRSGGPPHNGGPPDNGRPPDRSGGPPDNGGPPDGGGPPDDGRPPDDGGPPGNG